MILTDLVLGQDNKFAALYDPTRKDPPGSKAKGGKGRAKKVASFLAPGKIGSAADLTPGQGAVIGPKKDRKAVYRDDKGRLHARTAICPHLGCIVEWNPLERSFDCPCHGSRFTAYGKVVCGPANADLEKARLNVDEKDEPENRRR